jgi:CRISPR-associated protein Cmr4
MKAHLYKIECLTNMHVGSGEVNYSIIDNEVEKDPILGTPTIFSSGVKGALRQRFEELGNTGESIGFIKEIFGADGESTSKGAYKFFGATMISRPLRVSDGNGAYVNSTSLDIINSHLKMLESIGINKYPSKELPRVYDNKFIVGDGGVNSVEGLEAIKAGNNNELLNKLIGDKWAITSHKTLCNIALPVIARNRLENGKSKNLWYEEIVPHKTLFHFIILTPEEENKLDKFFEKEVFQFGGNASIGYGYTRITKVV